MVPEIVQSGVHKTDKMHSSESLALLRKYFPLGRCSVPSRWELCGAFSTAVVFLDQQACNYHKVIRQHRCPNQKLEVLSTLCKTSLHTATAQENRYTTLDASTELLGVLESAALFKCLLVRRLFAATLGNAYEFDATVFALLDIVPAEKSSIAAIRHLAPHRRFPGDASKTIPREPHRTDCHRVHGIG